MLTAETTNSDGYARLHRARPPEYGSPAAFVFEQIYVVGDVAPFFVK